jgi:homoserine kinase
LAASFEGHADNAAASLLGGLVLAWTCRDGFHSVRLETHPRLSPVMLVPATTSATEITRGLLPEHVPLPDAAFNAGRAALAVHAITACPDLLLAATEDRLHQEYRAPAMPESAALVERLRAEGVPAVISGAGPTVMALTDAGTADKVEALAGADWAANRLSLDAQGASVLPLTAPGDL